MAGNFDFTGYVPIEGASTNAHLSINHEQTPGGVTILNIAFDSIAQSWSYDFAEDVDFSGVGGTARNCSGTVTPWGTIISSEESLSGDNNMDGYNDIGWSTEIDPTTREIINQVGGLEGADKLWALGNFAHENVVVHNNRRTVYQAEDVTGGHLYKFVADVAEDLSAGDLYVYVGQKNGGGNWVQLANDTPAEQNTTIAQANSVGATDFAGGEDVEISPIDGKIYVAVKNENVVYRFDDEEPLLGGAVTNFETFVGNESYTIQTDTGSQVVGWGRGNDNLAFDDMGNLWVLQDGSNDHIWVVAHDHTQAVPKVRIFGRSPAGSEPTGITFSPDYKYLFMSFQHPTAANNSSSQTDAFQDLRSFDKDVAIVVARKEYLGNCHPQAGQIISSTAELQSNSSVMFSAGMNLNFDPDFIIETGATFVGDIEDCSVIKP